MVKGNDKAIRDEFTCRRVNVPNGYPYQIIIIATKVTIKVIIHFSARNSKTINEEYNSIDIKRWKKNSTR